MDTDNRVAPPIPFVYCFCLQNLQRHMCCRAIKTKLGVAVSAYQCLERTLTAVTNIFGRIARQLFWQLASYPTITLLMKLSTFSIGIVYTWRYTTTSLENLSCQLSLHLRRP